MLSLNLKSVYSGSDLASKIDDYLASLNSVNYEKSVKKTDKDETEYKAKFVFDKKFGNITSFQNFCEVYDHISFEMTTKNITLYNHIFNPDHLSIATAFYALLYFGSVIVPIADWVQGQLRSDQQGAIQAHYCSEPDHLTKETMISTCVRREIHSFPHRREILPGHRLIKSK